jgi:hypothetical protein
MTRKIRSEVFSHTNRPHPGTTTAMRDRKRLVQIEVTDIGTNRRRTGQPDLRVHVGAVHVHLPAMLVDDGADVTDVVFEHAVRGRVGDHQARQLVPMVSGLLLQIGEIDVTVCGSGDHDDAHSCHRRAGRIGPVCGRRDQYDIAMTLLPVPMKRANHQQAGELALCAGVRLQ